jgi:hypothetical protein
MVSLMRSLSTHGLGSRALVRLRDERGIALIMAIGIMLVLTIALSTTIFFTSASARHANHSNAGQKAYSVAEAGVNDALSILNKNYASDTSYLNPPALWSPPSPIAFGGGQVTWSGIYCRNTTYTAAQLAAGCKIGDYAVWRLKGIGTVPNPTGPGAAPVARTVTAKVQVLIKPDQPSNNDIWNWVYSGAPAAPAPNTCSDDITNSVNITAPMYVVGNLCIGNSTKIIDPGTGQDDRLVVGGQLFLQSTQNLAGCVDPNSSPIKDVPACHTDLSSPFRLREVHIVGGCVSKADNGGISTPLPGGGGNGGLRSPCSGPQSPTDPVDGTSSVFVKPLGFFTALPAVQPVPPVTDLDQWYAIADPGPSRPCSVVSGTPPTFDNNTLRDNSLPAAQNLTPTGQSYTCQTLDGELSWNATTNVLTVRGPIFIDGSAYIDTNNQVATYDGRATIYVSGTFLIKNAKLCAKANATDCDFTTWDPNAASGGDALLIAAFGKGGIVAPQNQVPVGDGINVQAGANFQGLLYATNIIEVGQTSVVQGPMVSPASVKPAQSGSASFPPITILPGGTPGTPPLALLQTPQEFAGG